MEIEKNILLLIISSTILLSIGFQVFLIIYYLDTAKCYCQVGCTEMLIFNKTGIENYTQQFYKGDDEIKKELAEKYSRNNTPINITQIFNLTI